MEMNTEVIKEQVSSKPMSQGQTLLTEAVEKAKAGQVSQSAMNTESQAKAGLATEQAAVAQAVEAKENNDPEFARKFAALSKKGKELYLMEKQLKEREAKIAKYEELERLKEESPYEFVQKAGLDFDKLVNSAVKHGEPPTIEDTVQQMQKKIDNYLAEKEREKVESERRSQQENIDKAKRLTEDKLKSLGDELELLNALGDYESVYSLMNEHYEKTKAETGEGEILDAVEAAKMVESKLLERFGGLSKVKKLSSIFAPPIPEAKQSASDSLKPKASGVMANTLSNSISARAEPVVKPKSLEERLAQSAALIKWN